MRTQISQSQQAGLSVRLARETIGWTRAQLAEQADVSERTVASLELGNATGVRLDKLLAVLHALGMSLYIDYGLLERKDDNSPTELKSSAQRSIQ